MRVIDRRGKETPQERRERILRRHIPAGLFLAIGIVLFGIEGCAAIEVAAGRARVTSALFWILLSGIAGYFVLMGLEMFLIGSARLARPLYRVILLAAPHLRGGPHFSIPPPRLETPGERARWHAFWGGLRRRFRRHR